MRRLIYLSIAGLLVLLGGALAVIWVATQPSSDATRESAVVTTDPPSPLTAGAAGIPQAIAAEPGVPQFTSPSAAAPTTPDVIGDVGFGGPPPTPVRTMGRSKPRAVAYGAPIVPLPADPDDRTATLVDLRAQRKAQLMERLNQRAAR